MEHVEGRTLAQMIPLDGLPLAEFLKIAVPLADALSAAHARGIQHRDLKPSNVMVTDDGRVKVLDFGLAQAQGARPHRSVGFQPETTLTQAGLAIGTLAYMAPEQLRMHATDHRSDIFSLGVVLFEMASGHCPFLGQSTAEVISSILRDQPARIYEATENVPEELDAILRRCLEKEPAKRWQHRRRAPRRPRRGRRRRRRTTRATTATASPRARGRRRRPRSAPRAAAGAASLGARRWSPRAAWTSAREAESSAPRRRRHRAIAGARRRCRCPPSPASPTTSSTASPTG